MTTASEPPGLAGAFARGIAWTMGMRWGIRGLGFLSTVVVARLLMPADYGIVAMATLVTGLIQVFLEANAGNALLREANASDSFIDSTWTITVIQSCLLAALMAIAAPIASLYFEEPRLRAVMWVATIGVLLNGFGSMGPLLARKGLDYGLEVKLLLFGRVVNLVVTVVLALWWRNYWALIVGGLAGTVSTFVASYLTHPYRPRIDFTHTRSIFQFSQWMIVSGIGVFAARKLDNFVIGRVGTTADLGIYNLGMELGQMITTELGAPLSRALMPVLATLQADPARMRSTILKTTAAVNLVTLPAGIGLALVAPVLVPFMLGPQWTAAVPVLIFFSVIGAIRYLSGPYFALFMVQGRTRLLAGMSWFECAAFAVFAVFFYRFGILGIVYARVASTAVIVAAWLVLGHRNGLPFMGFIRAVARPSIACLVMSGCVLVLPLGGLPPIVQLAAIVVVGALVYVATVSIGWLVEGRPDGIESKVVDRLGAFRAKR